MRVRVEKKRDPNAWMVTFSDLVTLMITFFVMLLTMSTMDVSRIRESFQYFPGASTVMEGGKPTVTETETSMVEMVRISSRAGEKSWLDEQDTENFHALKRWLMDRDLAEKVKVVRKEDRFEIHLDNSIVFRPGTTTIQDTAASFFAEVAGTMARMDDVRMRVTVISSDPSEVGPASRFQNLETLATERAGTLVLRFQNVYGVSPRRLSMIGYDREPVSGTPVPDDSFGQRVELVFLQQDDPATPGSEPKRGQ